MSGSKLIVASSGPPGLVLSNRGLAIQVPRAGKTKSARNTELYLDTTVLLQKGVVQDGSKAATLFLIPEFNC